jgi:PEP-CTERM motif
MEVRMQKILVGMFAIAGALMASPAARADVAYKFVVTNESPTLAALPAGIFAPTLTVTNAAFMSGTMDYSFTGGANKECNHGTTPGAYPCTVTGSGFVSLVNQNLLTGNDQTDVGYVIADIAFQPDGDLSGSLSASAFDNEDYSLSDSNGVWTGYFDTEAHSQCGLGIGGHTCTYTGYWAGPPYTGQREVPEPSAAILLASGLLGLGWVSRRKFI